MQQKSEGLSLVSRNCVLWADQTTIVNRFCLFKAGSSDSWPARRNPGGKKWFSFDSLWSAFQKSMPISTKFTSTSHGHVCLPKMDGYLPSVCNSLPFTRWSDGALMKNWPRQWWALIPLPPLNWDKSMQNLLRSAHCIAPDKTKVVQIPAGRFIHCSWPAQWTLFFFLRHILSCLQKLARINQSASNRGLNVQHSWALALLMHFSL